MKKEIKVSQAQAINEIAEWLEDLEITLPAKPQEDPAFMQAVKAMMHGHLVINGEGEAVYTPHRPRSTHKEPLVFRERMGADMLNGGTGTGRTYRIMASICGVDAGTFSKLAGADITTCEAIYSLLME